MVPLPVPAQKATVRQPTVYHVIDGAKESRMPDTASPAKTNIKILNGLNLSPR
ncbi:hypothetical protein D3C84_1226030 [compost metagenome]